MTQTAWHFPIFIVVSFLAFIGILRLATRGRDARPPAATVLFVAAVVVIGGMVFAKIGATRAWPVWLYYGLPAALTWLLPPIVFRLRGCELPAYLVMALLLAPTIHVLFSLLLGWKEYMPFIPVSSLTEVLG